MHSNRSANQLLRRRTLRQQHYVHSIMFCTFEVKPSHFLHFATHITRFSCLNHFPTLSFVSIVSMISFSPPAVNGLGDVGLSPVVSSFSWRKQAEHMMGVEVWPQEGRQEAMAQSRAHEDWGLTGCKCSSHPPPCRFKRMTYGHCYMTHVQCLLI